MTIPLDKQYVPVVRKNKTVSYKTAYFGKVHLGFPQQQAFTVVFDTGSGRPSAGAGGRQVDGARVAYGRAGQECVKGDRIAYATLASQRSAMKAVRLFKYRLVWPVLS